VSKVLVLGDGLLGSELVKQTGWQYVSRKKNKLPLDRLLTIILSDDSDILVNCIANTDTYSDDKDLIMDVNFKFIVELVNELEIGYHRQKKLVHISTDYVYSNSVHYASETDVPIHNESWYAYSKLLADAYIENFSKNYLICRMTHKPKPFPFDKAWKNQIGNFDYVDEQVKRLIKLIEVGATGVVNIGGEDTSMYELALKTNPKVEPNECEHPVPNILTMNTDKMRELLR
tara:strand:+ start:302 stop:994 length:693 start_codon:yes stop_codon:yes gene_type:complete